MFGTGKDNGKWWLLGAMGLVLGIILLDETVVGVALPTIRKELGMSQVGAHWVVNVYLLVFAGFAAAAGKIGDLVDLKKLFILGVGIFALASLACGFAREGVWLIGARAAQGIGAAIIFPISMAILTRTFAPEERGAALGIYTATGTVFLALGPLVGGFLTEFLSWRWIFWVNPLIVAAIILIVLAATVNQPRERPRFQIDVWGLLSLAGGIGMGVFAMMQGPDWGWSDPVIMATLAGGVILLALFVLLERRIALPLIDVRLFRGGTFSASNLTIFCAQYTQMAIVIFGALYLQNVLKMSPLNAGLALLAAVAISPLVAVPIGRLIDRTGARPVVLAGLATAVAAMLWIGLAAGRDSFALLAPAFVAWGLSNNALFIAARKAVVDAVPEAMQSQAAGIAMTAQLLGGAIGVAVCSLVYALTDNYSTVFLTTAGFVLVVLAAAWFGMGRRMRAGPS